MSALLPIDSIKPVSNFEINEMGCPFSSVPTLVPISTATNIPVKAPPAISPELNNDPGPISDSALDLFFDSASHFIIPPAKIGVMVDNGRYTPIAKASELTPQSSITAAIPIPIITNPQGKFWLNNP